MEKTVYDEAVERLALRLGITVDLVNQVMDGYAAESKAIHKERGHIKSGPAVASTNRTVLN
jgi:hypothetical protein